MQARMFTAVRTAQVTTMAMMTGLDIKMPSSMPTARVCVVVELVPGEVSAGLGEELIAGCKMFKLEVLTALFIVVLWVDACPGTVEFSTAPGEAVVKLRVSRRDDVLVARRNIELLLNAWVVVTLVFLPRVCSLKAVAESMALVVQSIVVVTVTVVLVMVVWKV